MDAKRLSPLPPIQAFFREIRRIQRKIHVLPDGASGWLLRLPEKPPSAHLPKFFSASLPMAVLRPKTRGGFMPLARREIEPDNLEFHDLHPILEDFFSKVKEGFHRNPKSIPHKFFYDEGCSFLFQQITELPEYYLTRVETRLLKEIIPEIAPLVGSYLNVVEYGCGSS